MIGHTRGKKIDTAIEDRLQEDWEQAALQPGVHQAVNSARGGIEHRSKIQHYPATIRAAWALASGIASGAAESKKPGQERHWGFAC